MQKYHYFYKITNLLNGHFYYGVHNTNNINDGYMGSGKRLHYAYKKYGMENFEKEILKYFDSAIEAYQYEADYITEEMVIDPNCYNLKFGGDGWQTQNLVTVRDKEGNIFDVHYKDPRYLSGELVGVTKGFTNCYDTLNKKFVQIPNEQYDNNRYVGLSRGFTTVRLKTETCKYYLIPKEQYDPEIYDTPSTNMVLVRDNNGKYYSVSKTDPRYLIGELKPIWVGKTHSEAAKCKMRETHKLNKHQQGEKNSQFGTCWISKDGESKKIKKEYLNDYISIGWIKGRICLKNK